MLEEAYREVLNDAFDLKNAQLIIDEIENGVRKIDYRTYSPVPSPLSHSLILSGLSDIVLSNLDGEVASAADGDCSKVIVWKLLSLKY